MALSLAASAIPELSLDRHTLCSSEYKLPVPLSRPLAVVATLALFPKPTLVRRTTYINIGGGL